MADFTSIGNVEDFQPGRIRDCTVNGQPVCVARAGDRFYAFGAFCTHEYISLSYGYLGETEVFCGQHDAAFDLASGEVTRGPAEFDIAVYPVKIEGGEVLVGHQPLR